MKRIQIRKLEKIVGSYPITIVHFTSDRCIPCKRQERVLRKLCHDYESSGVKCVEIDIDHNQVGISKLSKLRITRKPKAIPSLMVYVNGKPQTFKDTKFHVTSKILFGERKNIETVLHQSLKKVVNQ